MQAVILAAAICGVRAGQLQKEVGEMSTEHGRDGPAKIDRCRGDSLTAATPASDQTPSASKSGFYYGSPSPGAVQMASSEGCGEELARASDDDGHRTHTQARGKRRRPSFQGRVYVEYRSSDARKKFILDLLWGDGPPPDAAAGPRVRQPRRPRHPSAGGVGSEKQQTEEVVLVGG